MSVRRIPSYRQPLTGGTPESAPVGPTAPEAPDNNEALKPVAEFLAAFDAHRQPGSTTPAPALSQREGYTVVADEQRAALLAGLSERVGFDVAEALTNVELLWRARCLKEAEENAAKAHPTEAAAAEAQLVLQHGGVSVDVLPWMKKALGLDNPDQGENIVGATKREVILGVDPNTSTLTMLTEIEVPKANISEQGVEQTIGRLIYVHSHVVSYGV